MVLTCLINQYWIFFKPLSRQLKYMLPTSIIENKYNLAPHEMHYKVLSRCLVHLMRKSGTFAVTGVNHF